MEAAGLSGSLSMEGSAKEGSANTGSGDFRCSRGDAARLLGLPLGLGNLGRLQAVGTKPPDYDGLTYYQGS